MGSNLAKSRQKFLKLNYLIVVYIYTEEWKFWIVQWVTPLAMLHVMFVMPWVDSICVHTFLSYFFLKLKAFINTFSLYAELCILYI